MQRTIAIRLEDDADLRETLESYRIIQQSVSEIAAKSGSPSAIQLHRKSYSKVKGPLKAQLVCTAIRAVAAAYAQRKKKSDRPIQFKNARALFLIGNAKRDAGINQDGTISIWTTAGRKKLKFTTPDAFKTTMASATSFDALCVSLKNGRIHATLSVTVPDREQLGALPVGVDMSSTNTIAAVDVRGRSMCVTGVAHQVMMKTGEKTRRRLEKRLTTRKAEGLETRSVRRALKRLSRRRYLQTKDFCNVAAKHLVNWAGPNTVLVLEDFRQRSPSKRKADSRVGPAFYEILRRRIEQKSAVAGISVAYIEPAKSELSCSRCGSEAFRSGSQLDCRECGLSVHLDKSVATNIRNRYTVLKTVGCGQPAPKLDNG